MLRGRSGTAGKISRPRSSASSSGLALQAHNNLKMKLKKLKEEMTLVSVANELTTGWDRLKRGRLKELGAN